MIKSLLAVVVVAAFISTSWAAEPQKINVDSLQQKYWDRGEETELRVVQNRLFPKAGRLEMGAFGGIVSTDPFLSVKNLGATLGYHLNEMWGFFGLYWKDFSNSSSALVALETQSGRSTNTNPPHSFMGLEVAASPIYGKLSFFGTSIIHYDLHLLGGLGISKTETGNYVTPLMGIGQEIFINKRLALRLDYRLTRYEEDIKEKIDPASLGKFVKKRVNYSDVITVGFSFLL